MLIEWTLPNHGIHTHSEVACYATRMAYLAGMARYWLKVLEQQ